MSREYTGDPKTLWDHPFQGKAGGAFRKSMVKAVVDAHPAPWYGVPFAHHGKRFS